MAKKITGLIKLQIPAGQANPAPPVGPALGQHGVNIMAFCKEFNAKTKDQPGMIIPVVITVYQDKSFTFITKSPPGLGPAQKSSRDHRGLQGAEQGKGRQGDAQAGAGHREDQAEGFERDVRGGGVSCRGRHRPQHGHRGRRLALSGTLNVNTTAGERKLVCTATKTNA